MSFSQPDLSIARLTKPIRLSILFPFCMIAATGCAAALLAFWAASQRLDAAHQRAMVQAGTQLSVALRSDLHMAQRVALFADRPSSAAAEICPSLDAATPQSWSVSATKDGQLLCPSSAPAAPANAVPGTTLEPGIPAIMPATASDTLAIGLRLAESGVTLRFAIPQATLCGAVDLPGYAAADAFVVVNAERQSLFTLDCGAATAAARHAALDDFSGASQITVTPGTVFVRIAYPLSGFSALQRTAPFHLAIILGVLSVVAIIAAGFFAAELITRLIRHFGVMIEQQKQGGKPGNYLRHSIWLSQEFLALGAAISRTVDNIVRHAAQLQSAIEDEAKLLNELHHRVKNNFQLIAGLLRLHKGALPPAHQNNIRFIEEHVQAMAIAYRLAYAAKDNSHMPATDIAKNIILAVQDTAKLPADALKIIVTNDKTILIDLDTGIALALCLAYLVPPYLDGHDPASGALTARIESYGDTLDVELVDVGPLSTVRGDLRRRLVDAYIRQLGATILDADTMNRRFAFSVELGKRAGDQG